VKQQSLSRQFDKRRTKKAGRVTRTSVLAWLESDRKGRDVRVTRMLSGRNGEMTSAELARRAFRSDKGALWLLLYVRRGLSDAMARGAVVHAGKRRCTETGRICVTWRVATR
jgi:hypothetical protein